MLELLLVREFFHCAPCVSLFFTCPLAIKLPFPFKENKLAASRRGTISTFSHLHGTHPCAHVREWEREDKRKKKHKSVLKFFRVFLSHSFGGGGVCTPRLPCIVHALLAVIMFYSGAHHLYGIRNIICARYKVPILHQHFITCFRTAFYDRARTHSAACVCTGRGGRDVCSPGKRSAACAVHHENLNAPTVPTWIQIYLLLPTTHTQPHTRSKWKIKRERAAAAYKLPDMCKREREREREQFSFDFPAAHAACRII